jgi:hypothetical protein
MRLDDARLCLDCEEIHDEQECPTCGSEASAFLKRWIKTTANAGDRRSRMAASSSGALKEPATDEQLDAWRRIVEGRPAPPGRGKLVMRGLVGLAAMGVAGWAWSKTGRSGQAGEPGRSGQVGEPRQAGQSGQSGRSGRSGQTGLATVSARSGSPGPDDPEI